MPRKRALGYWVCGWAAAAGWLVGCAQPHVAATPLAGASKPKTSAASSSATASPALDLDGTYQGDMTEVMEAYGRDAVEVKRRAEVLQPRQAASREQVLTGSAAQGDLYLKLRNKLARVTQEQLWHEKTRLIIQRGAHSDNEELRQKALRAATNGSQAWAHRCDQDLAAADRVVAHSAGVVWRLGQAQPGLEARLEDARTRLAVLQAQRGDGWLSPILEPLGLSSRAGMFGAPPLPSPLPMCVELGNLVAPLGPVAADTAPLPDRLQLPPAARVVTALAEAPRVYITPLGVYWGQERQRVARLGHDAATVGVALPAKRALNDLEVVPLADALRQQPAPSQLEVLLFADQSTPFRVLVEVLFTLGKAGYGHFLLVTRPGDSSQVQGVPVANSQSVAHDLTVFMVKLGYAIVLDGTRVGADCGAGPQAGMAVPLLAGRLDPAGLAACVARLLPGEEPSTATITGNEQVTYADVISTTEALRPRVDVVFGVAK